MDTEVSGVLASADNNLLTATVILPLFLLLDTVHPALALRATKLPPSLRGGVCVS